MTYAQRFAFALAVAFALSLTTARAQTPSVSTVNVTPDERKVRVSSVGDVLDMRVAVSDESGDVVFESGPADSDRLDWTMSDPQGRRVPPGSYTLTVTYRTTAGKLKRRVEQVLVTEEVTGEARQQQESAAPTPAAPVEGAGSAGKIAKFTAANTVGNSVMTENANRIGVNTATPTHTLTINGGPAWTTSGWVGSIALPNVGAVGWAANGAGQRQGIGHNNGGLFFFRTTSNPGTATSAAVNDLTISNAGNVGVGTTTPASKLTVNGGVQILGAGNGIKFPDGSIQTKAIAGTINGTGTANRLAKFTGPNSFGNSSVAEVAGRVGIGTTSPARPLHIASGQLRLSSASGDIEFGETADLIAHATTASPDPVLPALRVNVGTGLTPAFNVLNNGNVGIGIGTTNPLRALQIGESPDAAFTIEPSDGSPNAGYIRFGDGTGWALRFGRQRETSGGPLNTGTTGTFMSISDKGGVVISRLFVDFNQPGGDTSVCRTAAYLFANCSSSLRYKTAVQSFAGGLELVRRLRPISFEWKSSGKRDLGLAAEEVAQIEPRLVTHNPQGEVEGVKYEHLNVVLINAIKEQQTQIREQQKLIGRLQSRLTRLERMNRRRRAAPK